MVRRGWYHGGAAKAGFPRRRGLPVSWKRVKGVVEERNGVLDQRNGVMECWSGGKTQYSITPALHKPTAEKAGNERQN